MPHRFTATAPRARHTDIDPDTIRTWRNLRTGYAEVRLCASTDGAWVYERLDDRGTTWRVLHVPTGRVTTCEVSLIAARSGTWSGWTLREMDRAATAATRPRCGWRSPWGTGSVCSDTAGPDGRCDRHPLPATVGVA